jgi:hypothetical protein
MSIADRWLSGFLAKNSGSLIVFDFLVSRFTKFLNFPEHIPKNFIAVQRSSHSVKMAGIIKTVSYLVGKIRTVTNFGREG